MAMTTTTQRALLSFIRQRALAPPTTTRNNVLNLLQCRRWERSVCLDAYVLPIALNSLFGENGGPEPELKLNPPDTYMLPSFSLEKSSALAIGIASAEKEKNATWVSALSAEF